MSQALDIQFSSLRMLWLDPFLRGLLRRHLRGILSRGELFPDEQALNVLMVQHVGRWDGFVVRQLQRRDAPESRLVTIMLDRQLNRYPVFRRAGAIGITPGSAASGRQLIRTVRERMRPGDCVALFPQGRIETVDADPERIEPGYRHFEHPHLPTRFTPVALSIEPLTHARPTCFMEVGTSTDVDGAATAFAATVHSLRSWLRAHGETADQEWNGVRLL